MFLLKIVEAAKIDAPTKTVDTPMILNTGGQKGEAIRIEGTKRGEEKGNDRKLWQTQILSWNMKKASSRQRLL